MKRRQVVIAAVLYFGSAVLFIAGQATAPLVSEQQGFDNFFNSLALFLVGCTYVVGCFFKMLGYKMLSLSAEMITGLAISNLVDELFFDPTKVAINEYIFLGLIILYLIYEFRKDGGDTRRNKGNSGGHIR